MASIPIRAHGDLTPLVRDGRTVSDCEAAKDACHRGIVASCRTADRVGNRVALSPWMWVIICTSSAVVCGARRAAVELLFTAARVDTHCLGRDVTPRASASDRRARTKAYPGSGRVTAPSDT